jgi:zinc/manganese transport system substrate-binding protein
MRCNRYLTGLLTAGILLCAVPGLAREIRVVATTTDVGALYRRIGGEQVDVTVLCRGWQDPHYLQAKPSFAARMRRADLLAYVGLQLEVGYLPVLIESARNRNLLLGASGNVPMAEGITILEVPEGEVSRAQGDVHPEGNPHYWLDPRNLLVMAETVESSLIRIDPEGSEGFHERKEAFRRSLSERIPDWEERMAPLRGRRVVCHHKEWEYLCAWLGLEVLDYVENKAGVPPSPRHLQDLIADMRHHGVEVVMAANFVDPGPARRVAEETGARVVILPASVEGEEGIDEPEDLFEVIVERLESAWNPKGAR